MSYTNATYKSTFSKLRIAVVVPKYGLVGGGERFASEVTERLAREGSHEIHVFANQWASNSERITFHKVPIIRFPRFLRPLSFAWLAQRLVGRESFDLVHSHDRIFRADVFSVHFVPHNGWIRNVRSKRPSLFDRATIYVERRMLAAGRDSWFLPVSSLAEATFRGEYEELSGYWRAIHPGVESKRFGSPDRDKCRAEIRARYGIDASDFLILFVGMNFEVKGLDTIIKAVSMARMAHPQAGIRLLVVGRGNERKYRELARSYGAAEAVSFAGTLATEIEKHYRAADLFAMLSTFDTFGMVVLEAMAAGLPVLISSTVGAKDLVQEGINGFVLSKSPDANAAAERIIQMLDIERREAMGAMAMQTAAEHDWKRVVSEICDIYALHMQKRVV